VTTATDESFMRRAIAVAVARLGTTGSNPAVGCVMVSAGRVVAEAATGAGGRPHAEEQAVFQAGEATVGATAFVTLEPCGERTSGAVSCAERLASAGVIRVVYAIANPDGRSAGRGPARLRAAGIVVEAGLLAKEAAALYAGFLSALRAGRGSPSRTSLRRPRRRVTATAGQIPSRGDTSLMASLQEITDRIRAAVGADSGLGKTLKFNLKGDGFVFIDGGTVTNEDAPADLTLTIAMDDLVALGESKLDAMNAVMTGRLQLSDMGLAMALQGKMQALFSKMA